MVKIIFSVLLVSILSGCVTYARVDHMVANKADRAIGVAEGQQFKGTLELGRVEGDTKGLLKQALSESLRGARLLAEDNGKAAYTLEVTEIRFPGQRIFEFGFEFTAALDVEYALIEKASGKVVYKKTLSSKASANMSDSWFAGNRKLIALERAARDNFEKVVDELLSLKV
ncbi:MAG: hypothetical protein EPO42_10310 [Gallionellaceae bacterium]|nr:MAG: hypothetical protein EPO42_10310 [Gallionellaceae bacterium]